KNSGRNRANEDAWSRAFDAFLVAQAKHAEVGHLADANPDDSDLDKVADAACDAEVDAMSALMAIPAPNGKALLFKLNKIIASEESTGSTPSWSWAFVQQTVADMRRLLGGEC
ncbi:MAG: hypothetical protein ACTHKR_13700, partial [Sphingomonas sp.]